MDLELFNSVLQVGTLNLEERKSRASAKGSICSRYLRLDAFQSLDLSGGTEGHVPGPQVRAWVVFYGQWESAFS